MLPAWIQINNNTIVILNMALMLFSGFLMTRVTKRFHLPNVTGYILAGILIGPYVLKWIKQENIVRMEFIIDVALSFIAFGVGRYLNLKTMRKNGAKVIVITLFEALTAALFIFLAMVFLFHLPVSFAVILGAIGCATAPASTIMTIRQYHAKGDFVNMVLQVIALDDAVALVAFSVCAAVAEALQSRGSFHAGEILMPILFNAVTVLLAVGFGFLLHKLIHDRRSSDHRLVVTIGMILVMAGLCSALNISPLLSCMALGTTYINVSKNKALFRQMDNFTPPVYTLFFVLSGMRLDITLLKTVGIIGVAYFIIRILGKYLGAFVGASLCRESPEIKKYLGLSLMPQAGVSIGLAALGQRILPGEMGALLSTIILSSAVLYEMIGPGASKLALYLSRSYSLEENEKGETEKKEEGEREENQTEEE